MDWESIFNDESVLLQIINDSIVRGPYRYHSSLSNAERFNLIVHGGSKERFSESLSRLTPPGDVEEISNLVGYSVTYVERIIDGEIKPDARCIEKFAEAYSVTPEYFLEYRIGAVVSSLEAFLSVNPELADSWYGKVKNNDLNQT